MARSSLDLIDANSATWLSILLSDWFRILGMTTPITAIILTKNEEANLSDCLASVKWVDEILVVDSFSVDRTAEIAHAHNARFIQHPFLNYAAQRNFAQGAASHDWVLHIDADERVTPALAREIQQLSQTGQLDKYHAYYFARVDLWLGFWFPTHPERYRLTSSIQRHLVRNRFIRLYDRRHARWRRALHEVIDVAPPVGFLQGCITHYSATNLSRMLETFNSYTDLEAAQLFATGNRSNPLHALYRGFRAGAYLYFAWRLYRYGAPGLAYAIHQGYVKYMNYLKLWELQRIAANRGVWTSADYALLQNATQRVRSQEETEST